MFSLRNKGRKGQESVQILMRFWVSRGALRLSDSQAQTTFLQILVKCALGLLLIFWNVTPTALGIWSSLPSKIAGVYNVHLCDEKIQNTRCRTGGWISCLQVIVRCVSVTNHLRRYPSCDEVRRNLNDCEVGFSRCGFQWTRSSYSPPPPKKKYKIISPTLCHVQLCKSSIEILWWIQIGVCSPEVWADLMQSWICLR